MSWRSRFLIATYVLLLLTVGACGEGEPAEEPLPTTIALTVQPTHTAVPQAASAVVLTVTPVPLSTPTRAAVEVSAQPQPLTVTLTPTAPPAPATIPSPTVEPVLVAASPEPTATTQPEPATVTPLPTVSTAPMAATATPESTPTALPVLATASPRPTATTAPVAATATPEPTPTASPVLATATPEPTPPPATPTVTAEPTSTPVLDAAVATNGSAVVGEPVLLSETLTTVEVVKLLKPSVVHVATERLAMGMFTQPTPLQGVGTGVVLDLEGHILTNNHVVDEAQNIIVTLNTGESFSAELVGGDAKTDTAVIRIDAEGLQPAMLGDSSALEVGEDVIAIGHALGLPGGPTVSKGVVSALGRSIESDPLERIVIVDLIQTDASINPGNSGGPLVNASAEVVGINTAIIPQSQGIGFAININDAAGVAAQLIEQGFVRRGVLGIRPDNVTPPIAAQLELPVTEGVWIEVVFEGTAAEAAGLLPGDIIVQLGETPIANSGELAKFLIDHPPGETVTVVYFRGSERVTGEVTLGERPPTP